MSKVFSLLLISLLQLIVLPTLVLASETCSSSGITYSPDAFSPSSSAPVMHFMITNDNTFKYIQDNGKYVRLHFNHYYLPINDYNTKSVLVSGNTFDITLETDGKLPFYQDWMHDAGTHQAVLDLGSNPDGGTSGYNELCNGIKYTVGDPNTCRIDPSLPSQIPPNSTLSIKFSGKPDTTYYLHIREDLGIYIDNVKTGNDGQGEFSNIKITGTSGENRTLDIGGLDRRDILCTKPISISIGAPIPGTPAPGSIATPPPGTTVGAGGAPVGPPTTAGGNPCNDPEKGSGIQTAIGCIHTNPAALITDFLKFILGISGGIAFLLMLLGAFGMLTSAGNPDKLSAGKERLESAVIGLLFIIFSVLFFQILGANILGIEGFGK